MTTPYGEQLKLFGQEQALDAVPQWRDLARITIEVLAELGQPFTSEDVTDRIGLPRGNVGQHRNNAVGAAFSAAARRGIIRRIGYVNAERPRQHAAVLSIWVGVTAGDPHAQ